MLSRNYEFYLVITTYLPYGLPYMGNKCIISENTLANKTDVVS